MKVEQLQEGALCQQDLVEDRTLLKDLATIRRSAKGFLLRNSLPFPVDGVFWVPKKRIVELDEKFQGKREV